MQIPIIFLVLVLIHNTLFAEIKSIADFLK